MLISQHPFAFCRNEFFAGCLYAKAAWHIFCLIPVLAARGSPAQRRQFYAHAHSGAIAPWECQRFYGSTRETIMPEQATLKRARKDKAEGQAPSTQAGEFIREEIHHVREGKHGARSAKQAIAIGLSKARRAGVKLPPPERGTAPKATRQRAKRDYRKGQAHTAPRPSARRSRATLGALRQEGHSAASHSALSRQAHGAARRRSRAQRSASARRAARTRAR